jgi:hypothetical protein
MRAANPVNEQQTIATQSIIVADIMRILAIPLRDTPANQRLDLLARSASELRALAVAGGGARVLRERTLRGIALAEATLHEQMRSVTSRARKRSRLVSLAAGLNPLRGRRRAHTSPIGAPEEIARMRDKDAELLATLAQLRRELALSSQSSSAGARRKAKSRQDKHVESSFAG